MTLPPEASAASASEPEHPLSPPPIPGDLICAEQEIFDFESLTDRLAAAVQGEAGTGRRVRAITILSEELTRGRAAIEKAFLN